MHIIRSSLTSSSHKTFSARNIHTMVTTHVIRINMNKIAKNESERTTLRKEVSPCLKLQQDGLYNCSVYLYSGCDLIDLQATSACGKCFSPIRRECLRTQCLRHFFGCRNSIRREVKLPNIDATRHCGWFIIPSIPYGLHHS